MPTDKEYEIVVWALSELVLQDHFQYYRPHQILGVIRQWEKENKVGHGWYREKVQRILSQLLPETDVVRIKRGFYDLAPEEKRQLIERDENLRLSRVEKAIVDPKEAEKMRKEDSDRRFKEFSKNQVNVSEWFAGKDEK
jgi:hypothetical protein